MDSKQFGAAALLVVLLAVVVTGAVLTISGTAAASPFDTADACLDLSRRTLTSTPVGSGSREPVPAEAD